MKKQKKNQEYVSSEEPQERIRGQISSSGIELKEVYGEQKPGEFPYLRGPYPNMYKGKAWTMRQYSGFGSAKETNARFHYLLKNGQTGVSCAFDLPTQMGYDSDHPMAEGEVGRVGVAISSLEDMKVLLAKLPLHKISSSMTINSTATSLLSFYCAVAESQSTPLSEIRGTIQNDILKEYVARGTYIYPPRFSLKLVADSFRFAREVCPKWNPISISGYHIREAGATAAQEVAFTLQNCFTYVQTALDAGLRLEDFVPRLSFFFNVHNHFFEEIVKFRLARKIYAEEMAKRFDAPPEILKLRFHAQTAGSTLTAQQPQNNIVRVAYQALAAVLGGTQSLHTNSFDEALGLPTEKSALIALRTQQILLEETGVSASVDPLAGSYFVEELSEELEKKILSIMKEIDDRGGMLKCIESSWVQMEIQRSSYEAQKNIDGGRQGIVGVNCYETEEEAFDGLHQLDPKVVRDQKKGLKKFKANRKSSAVEKSLRHLQLQAQALEQGDLGAKVTESILQAVKSKCSLGEIADVLREVAGRHSA